MGGQSRMEPPHTVVLDIETRGDFPTRSDMGERRLEKIRLLPISVGCAYSSRQDAYLFFTVETIDQLFSLLKSADRIVGFNLLRFDYEVLGKYGLPKLVESRTLDLHHVLFEATGHRFSLDRLARHNLGQGKHRKGSELADLSGDELFEACRSDVELTKRLYELWSVDRLRWPAPTPRDPTDFEEWEGEPGLTVWPCPSCGGDHVTAMQPKAVIDRGRWDVLLEEADYVAESGLATCHSCSTIFPYG